MAKETNDVSETGQVGHRKTKAALLAQREQEELQKIIDTPGGRWFLWRLLTECGLFHTLSGHEPHKMAIMSGRRDVGLWVLDQINSVDAKGYLRIQNESNRDDRKI